MKRILLVLFFVMGAANLFAQPATVYVDDDFNSSTSGWNTTHFNNIQDGVDAVAVGGTVNVEGGSYYVGSTIGIDKSMTIIGTSADKNNHIIIGNTVDAVQIFNISASNVLIRHLTLTVSEVFSTYPSGEYESSLIAVPVNAGISSLQIRDCKLYIPAQPVPMSGWVARAITLSNNSVNGFSITGNTIYNTRNGIVVRNSNFGNPDGISNNRIFNTKGGIMNYTSSQADANNRTMTGNIWDSNVAGLIDHNEWDIVWNTAAYDPDYQQSVISLSELNNSAYVLDRRAVNYSTLTGNRSHIFVDASSTIVTPHPAKGNFNDTYKNIQMGVDAVADGGTVNVMGGTYVEQVTVGKTLNLIGNGSSKPAIDGNNSGLPILILTGDNITITGFTIRNSGLSSPACGIAMVQNSGCQIYNNNLFNNFIGIALAGSDENIIESNNITSNAACGVWINNDEDAAALGFTGCSYLNGSDNNIVRNNEITNNSGEGGIYIAEYCANNIVEFNNISDNNGNGIYLWKSDATIIRNNSCVGSNSTGIHIMASKDNEVYNNYFSSGNSLPAIHLRDGHRRNASGVWQDWTSSGNIINDNHFHANCPLLVKSESETVLDATCNWWGTSSHCDVMEGILGNVDFIPYLTSGTDSKPATHGFQPYEGTCSGTGGIVTNLNTGKWFCSIKDAIDDTDTDNGHILQAGDGVYNENITVTKELTIQAGSTPVINGQIIVSADNVTLQGLTIHNPDGNYGVYANGVSNLLIQNNIFSEIGTGTNKTSGVAYAIGYVLGSAIADNVQILHNTFNNIKGGENLNLNNETTPTGKDNNGSGAAIVVGWSNATGTLQGLSIENNKISNVSACYTKDWSSGGKGAYGILINTNNGSDDDKIGNGTINPIISNNIIDNLEGYWTTAIGLEGNTPDAIVKHNKITNLTQHKTDFPDEVFDANSVKVEDNMSAASVKINYNHFDKDAIGITNVTSIDGVDGRYNWWGSCDGPSGVGPGNGAAVTDYVDYEPWIGQDAVLWLSPTLLLGHSGNVSDWDDASCNNNDASMDQESRQPMYGSMIFNDGPAVAFANDYSNTGYANSDIMTVEHSDDVTSSETDQWNPSKNGKDLFIAFRPDDGADLNDNGSYYNDGRKVIFEAGGPLSGYNVYLYNGKVVFGMWNRFQDRFLMYDPSTEGDDLYPLDPTKSYIIHLSYNDEIMTARIFDPDGNEYAQSPGLSFAGISKDETAGNGDETGIGGAARTCYHNYNTGETYSDQFGGTIGDVIVYDHEYVAPGTPVVGGGDEEFDPQEIIDYLSARYFPEQGEVPGKIGSGWKVIENNRIEGFESVSAAYPNPFDATSSFSVNLPIEQNVIIELYDAMGNKVTDIFSGNLSKGIHDFTIDGANLTNGVYIFRVVGENFKADGKVVLNK